MLDALMPDKDGDGFRKMANGDVMSLEVIMFEGYADWADATEQVISDWAKVGIKATMRIGTRSNIGQEWQSNEGMIYNHPMDTAGFTFATAGPKTSFGYGLVAPLWRDWLNDNTTGVKPAGEVIEIYEDHKKGCELPPAHAYALAIKMYAYHAYQQYVISVVGLRP